MKALEKLRGKSIGLYIREEDSGENLSTGYGRLQWLKYELEEHEGGLEFYIDEKDSELIMDGLFDDIDDEYIEVILLWSIRDVDSFHIKMLVHLCNERDIPIVSFCESDERLNEIIKELIMENERSCNTNLEYF
ncbi:hypothetical protein [Clostridium sp. YIM B02551]|uniref:hypothetical protein n=1 Tax=Clostridium sp. YIM B02551 TaxID=2910679 RepID=UPI001EEB278E|nr:hypothetical protein [Clostridium sp. YIM B02551]